MKRIYIFNNAVKYYLGISISINIEVFNHTSLNTEDNIYELVELAVKDFKYDELDINQIKLFLFTSKQIAIDYDLNILTEALGEKVLKASFSWDIMRIFPRGKLVIIEVNIDDCFSASETSRKYVIRHELCHIYLKGPPKHVKIPYKELSEGCLTLLNNLKEQFESFLNQQIDLWAEYQTDLVMVKKFPKLVLKCMYENPKNYSLKRDKIFWRSKKMQNTINKLTASIMSSSLCLMEMEKLNRLPVKLKQTNEWKTIFKLHKNRYNFFVKEARKINPQIKLKKRLFQPEQLDDLKKWILRFCNLIPNIKINIKR